jgi:hypothetical protein
MARKKLSTLSGELQRAVTVLIEAANIPEHRPRRTLIVKNGMTGRVYCTVDPDDLFDADGNRFEDDLP